MATILCKVNGSASGKPRVYFTCHPDDFDRYFQKICDDIFKTHDVAIYYTEDMTEAIAEEDRETDLGSNNLFVVPVTYRLLSTPNRAMDSDIPYALEQHIPVLPFMMEPGIDAFYAKKFGELQYLNPYSTDLTEVRYEDKLKKYLESVLISDETAKRVREAFDAYIFLSYRKKDRRYANELMRLIHKNPEYRDIAIWYDEFLTPGESFRENIDRILRESDLFALLVTPQLLQMLPDGKKNFVMESEYPAAKESGITILPTEMETTDKTELQDKFPNVPECVNGRDEASLADRLRHLTSPGNDRDPEHLYLVGRAYLEGIDVEVDRQRGLELVTSAAETGFPEAMKALYGMYLDGKGVGVDYGQAVLWAEKLFAYYTQTRGEQDPETLLWLNQLAFACRNGGQYERALELFEKAYALHREYFGEEHPDTFVLLNNVASLYGDLGNSEKALALAQEAYVRHCNLPENHPTRIYCLNNVAVAYYERGEYEKALELSKTVYAMNCTAHGETHPKTLSCMNNLAFAYGKSGDPEKQSEILEACYAIQAETLGEEHPDTLTSLNNLAVSLCDQGNPERAAELFEKMYALRCKVLGQTHPDTMNALSNLAAAYNKTGNFSEAISLCEKSYRLHREVLGETHPDTLTILENLANALRDRGQMRKGLEHLEKLYGLLRDARGEFHRDTVRILNNIAYTYGMLGETETAFPLTEKAYAHHCKGLGEDHPDTLNALSNLAFLYHKRGDLRKALGLLEDLYPRQRKVLGKNHPKTVEIARAIRDLRRELGWR